MQVLPRLCVPVSAMAITRAPMLCSVRLQTPLMAVVHCRRPKWRVLMLGQTSDDFDGDLRYGLPTLLSLDSSTTATQAETNRIITACTLRSCTR